jgi:hypothetical protein
MAPVRVAPSSGPAATPHATDTLHTGSKPIFPQKSSRAMGKMHTGFKPIFPQKIIWLRQ